MPSVVPAKTKIPGKYGVLRNYIHANVHTFVILTISVATVVIGGNVGNRLQPW